MNMFLLSVLTLSIVPVPPKPPSSHRLRLRYGRGDMRFVSAHSVRLLVNAAEAYPEMLAAIDGATDHVEMETYTLRDDSAGRTFQQALVRASSRGVRVRLLYDWLGSLALPGPFVRELVEVGVAVSAYHPLV